MRRKRKSHRIGTSRPKKISANMSSSSSTSRVEKHKNMTLSDLLGCFEELRRQDEITNEESSNGSSIPENSDYFRHLSLEIICHILDYLPLRDVLKMEYECRKLQKAVDMHLRVRKSINFTEGKIHDWMPKSLNDSMLMQLISRCSELVYIFGLHPIYIAKRRQRGVDRLSIPGIVAALTSAPRLKGVEISDISLMEAVLSYLPHLDILGTFANRDSGFPINPVNKLLLPSNPRITSLHLTGVVIPELPRMSHLKHIYLRWVKITHSHPFRDFSVPLLQTFVMSNCAGPASALKYVPLITGLAAARSLSRLELVRVPFLGGLIQHIVEDSWRVQGFRQLQTINFGACKHALEVDLGFVVITSAHRLEELSIQPSLTKDSLFSAIKMADVTFPCFESLNLGYIDSFPETGKWTTEELTVLHGLSDVTENPAMITDIGMKATGQCFLNLKHMEIYNCPHLHFPTSWFSQGIEAWSHLRSLHLRRCHAIRLQDFCRYLTELPALESLHLEHMFREPPKGCARVGLSAGTGLGVSSALVQNNGNDAINADDGNNNNINPGVGNPGVQNNDNNNNNNNDDNHNRGVNQGDLNNNAPAANQREGDNFLENEANEDDDDIIDDIDDDDTDLDGFDDSDLDMDGLIGDEQENIDLANHIGDELDKFTESTSQKGENSSVSGSMANQNRGYSGQEKSSSQKAEHQDRKETGKTVLDAAGGASSSGIGSSKGSVDKPDGNYEPKPSTSGLYSEKGASISGVPMETEISPTQLTVTTTEAYSSCQLVDIDIGGDSGSENENQRERQIHVKVEIGMNGPNSSRSNLDKDIHENRVKVYKKVSFSSSDSEYAVPGTSSSGCVEYGTKREPRLSENRDVSGIQKGSCVGSGPSVVKKLAPKEISNTKTVSMSQTDINQKQYSKSMPKYPSQDKNAGGSTVTLCEKSKLLNCSENTCENQLEQKNCGNQSAEKQVQNTRGESDGHVCVKSSLIQTVGESNSGSGCHLHRERLQYDVDEMHGDEDGDSLVQVAKDCGIGADAIAEPSSKRRKKFFDDQQPETSRSSSSGYSMHDERHTSDNITVGNDLTNQTNEKSASDDEAEAILDQIAKQCGIDLDASKESSSQMKEDRHSAVPVCNADFELQDEDRMNLYNMRPRRKGKSLTGKKKGLVKKRKLDQKDLATDCTVTKRQSDTDALHRDKACQAISDEIREATKKAKEQEEEAKKVECRRI